MAGCLTCRQRKVKCDGRQDLCQRCEKLGLSCNWTGSPRNVEETAASSNPELTQAGYKRIRISTACETCRKKKLKCDALHPCTFCVRRKLDCQYVTAGRRRRETTIQTSIVLAGLDSERSSVQNTGNTSSTVFDATGFRNAQTNNHPQSLVSPRTASTFNPRLDDAEQEELDQTTPIDVSATGGTVSGDSRQAPSGQDLLPYLDSFLENVHPICCNNFLHGGILCEALDRAPPLLVLAICGSSAKFIKTSSDVKGQKWIDDAKTLIFRSLDRISTLTISAIQFVALHEMHQGDYTSAWNLTSIATRMALQLKLHEISPNSQGPGTFLQQECRRRLMWSVLVSDLLFNCDKVCIDEALVEDLPLPCNLWSFTQGLPCKTLTLRQLRSHVPDGPIKQSSNHCSYLINILVIRRRILRYIRHVKDYEGKLPWLPGSHFQALCDELDVWRQNLPPNYAFLERHMFTFRISRHLDIFLMIHAWYHQSRCLLFGAWMPGHPENIINSVNIQAPAAFLQDCTDQCLSHARDITSLIQKVLKVESDHLFRDPWFGLCIWDSTIALLASLQQSGIDASYKDGIAELLKLNLKALVLSRSKIALAGKIHEHTCARIRKHGLAKLVGVDAESNSSISFDIEHVNDGEEMHRRYPFLSPMRAEDFPAWKNIYHVTNFGGSTAATRHSSPERRGPESNGDITQTSQEEPSYTDENSMQILYPWLVEDFQWQQNQQANIDPAAAAAITGMMHRFPTSATMDIGVEQTDFPHRTFMPSTSLNEIESFERGFNQQ
ncbi:uncharacterized protein PAC_13912 [Phialocephala subalpina]|uniref:Zn(2)-C6 fungal-type domain-containing protein n=1 Tax=Phialocephala subalpina TaxID=576137 RepID=A0A1L7XG50_9HELO|nr:uncharacterized protein PAC_13912 [Phialocephala subalpina]